MLFLSTIINYIDRQTLSLLAPFLKLEYHWTNTDYANILIGFRVGYSIGQAILGRLMDSIGTRRGLSSLLLAYSLFDGNFIARGFYSFITFRSLLGLAESGNWPGATKAVSEWFPKRDRGLATALFDSGSSIGGAIAPFHHSERNISPFGLAACLRFPWLARISMAATVAKNVLPATKSIHGSARKSFA